MPSVRTAASRRSASVRTGRRLCQALLDAAIDGGYRVMRVDTGNQNAEALAMYQSLGFRECAPYHE